MNIQITGKNITVTPALQAYVDDKIGGLIKYNEAITEIRVTLEHVREQRKEEYRAAAQLHVGHEVLFTEEVAVDMYGAIDIVKDELIRQLRDLKNKLETKHRKANAASRDLKSAVWTF